MKYYFGFSWIGLVVIFLILVPNIFYFILPPTNVLQDANSEGIMLSILEHGSQMVMFFLFIFLIRDKKIEVNLFYMISMSIFLLLYYYLWSRYFMAGCDYTLLSKSLFGIPAPMAVFPIAYFLLSALWFGNWPAFGTTLIFGAAHLAVCYVTFK